MNVISILFRQISGGERVPKFDGTVNIYRLFGGAKTCKMRLFLREKMVL